MATNILMPALSPTASLVMARRSAGHPVGHMRAAEELNSVFMAAVFATRQLGGPHLRAMTSGG